MRTRLLRRASIGALALTLFGGTAALADQLLTDADALATGNGDHSDVLAVTQARGNTTAYDLSAAIKNTGSSTNDVFAATDDYVTVTLQRSGAWLAADNGGPASFKFTQYDTSQAGTLRVTVPCSAAKDDVETITVVLNATASNGKTLNPNTKTLTYTITAGDAESGTCVTNTAPSAPGTPVASENPTQGAFTLSWAASTDTQSDAFTYTLEGQDADDAAFTTIASGLTTNSHTFAADTPVEGTWSYRVKAVETSTSPALSSVYSPVSTAVVVDRTAPNAPTASADRDPEYNDSTTNWWKDSVTVSFSGNGDPSLPDSSAGSGFDNVSAPQSFSTTGTFTATGTATDKAGNTSQTSLSGAVDATSPEVTLQSSCPSGPIYFGNTVAPVSWTASDAGSGLSGAASGTLVFDTSSTGSKVAQVTVADNVEHQTTAKCEYTVLAWTLNGFFQPVDMSGIYNVVKGGSTVPLKFEVFAGPTELTDVEVVSGFTIAPTACPSAAAFDAVEFTTTGGTALRYDWTAGQFVQNWQTPKKPGACYKVTMTTDDGSFINANFMLK